MKANQIVGFFSAIILLAGCAYTPPTSAAAKLRHPVAHFTAPEQQQKILEEKIKVKVFALEHLGQEKPLALQQLTDVVGKENLTNTLKQADAARIAIQRDQSYLDALKSFYLALSNRQQAVTAELNIYRSAMTNHVAAAATNVVMKKCRRFLDYSREKRRRAAALQDADARFLTPGKREASWSAPALWRFGPREPGITLDKRREKFRLKRVAKNVS